MNSTRARQALACAAFAGLILLPARALATTLPDVLRDVLRRNPELGMQRWETEAARAQATRAGSWPSPMVEFGVTNVPTTGRFDQEPMTMKMIGVAQRVPVFGANRLARRAGDEAANADTAVLAALRLERVGEAWRAYGDAYYAGARAEISERHRGVMARMAAAARARYESGRGRLGDALRAEAEAARVHVDAAGFRAEEVEARARLSALAGAPASAALGALEEPPAFNAGPDPRPWIEAARRNPRVLERDANQRRYTLAARAARRMAWPDLELRASYGLRGDLAAPAGHSGSTTQDDMFSATVAFMLPLFAGGREFAEAREMDAMARAAEADRGRATLDLERATVAAHARVVAGERMIRLLVDTVLVAQQRALDAAWSAYAAGSVDLLTVLETAHMLYMEELKDASERAALSRARGELVALSGRLDLAGLDFPPGDGSPARKDTR